MNIYASPGRKVIFTGKNGYDAQRKKANELLEVGNIYTIKHIKVYSSISYVEFEELPGKTFNTVMFGDIEIA